MSAAPYSPQFLAYRAARDALQRRAREAGQDMARIAGPDAGTGFCGMTPDHIKARPDWRAAHASYWQAHHALRDLNGRNVRLFKRELAREREERRAALLAG